MKAEKHEEIIKEVLDEIESALKDPKGLVAHQRRLAFLLSLGSVELFELNFHKKNIIKEGAKISHLWFKRKKERILEQLQNQVVMPISTIVDVLEAVDIAIKIEEKRDDLAYGAPAPEKLLQEKINLFFELKKVLKC